MPAISNELYQRLVGWTYKQDKPFCCVFADPSMFEDYYPKTSHGRRRRKSCRDMSLYRLMLHTEQEKRSRFMNCRIPEEWNKLRYCLHLKTCPTSYFIRKEDAIARGVH